MKWNIIWLLHIDFISVNYYDFFLLTAYENALFKIRIPHKTNKNIFNTEMRA